MQKKSSTAGPTASALKTQRAKRDRERSSPRPPKTPTIKILSSEKLAEIPWLLHGFSTRQGGVSKEYGGQQLNLGFTAEDSPENVERNRARLLRKLKAQDAAGKAVAAGSAEPGTLGGDPPGVWRARAGVGAAAQEQSCWSRRRRADHQHGGSAAGSEGCRLLPGDCGRPQAQGRGHLPCRMAGHGAAHRGKRHRRDAAATGLRSGESGGRRSDPALAAAAYEIGEEVENEFDSQFAYSKELFEDVFDSWSLKTKYPMLFLNQRAPGHGEPAMSRHLDLVKANWCQLLDAGVPAENIQSMNQCTACHTELFFSYRKERVTGRMLAVVGIRVDEVAAIRRGDEDSDVSG